MSWAHCLYCGEVERDWLSCSSLARLNAATRAEACPVFADIGYESLINLMLKDLFKLLVACVSEPAETISRVGCSCIR